MVLVDLTTMELMRAIAAGDGPVVSLILSTEPALATRSLQVGASRQVSTDFFLSSIGHYVYAGDSTLHVAAAGYRLDTARDLMTVGADVAARNRRGAQPLHYAADGSPGSPQWNPRAQAAVIALLLEAGADLRAHRGPTRCSWRRLGVRSRGHGVG